LLCTSQTTPWKGRERRRKARREGERHRVCYGWRQNVLNTWSLGGGTILWGSENFRKWGLTGGMTLKVIPHASLFISLLLVLQEVNSLGHTLPPPQCLDYCQESQRQMTMNQTPWHHVSKYVIPPF
jgi:hypothetical protein